MNLKQQIEQAKKEKKEAEMKLMTLIYSCDHETVNNSHGSAECDICGEDLGWYCEKNPMKTCEYNWETHGEDCIHCGNPNERK